MRSAKIKLSVEASQPPHIHEWTNPIVPGDHPDPTIVQVDGVYWASATSGEWSPQFPLFRSPDLFHWSPAGWIFPVQPAWAEGSFWAPELVYDDVSGRSVLWYVARQRGGPLCIAVATAPSTVGPYTDHGALVCEDDGSIDPCFMRDENGRPYLIWKEDGNSAGRPTPIWAQALSDDLLRLEGEKTQLITNDQPWENEVVEGPFILRHEQRFYMFYAGNTCCGRECEYAEGVARADRLLGPWEKAPHNPIIDANDNWRCPGHGTAVQAPSVDGKPGLDHFLYHAYPTGGTIFVGREALLDEIRWSEPEADGRPGWPIVNAGSGPGEYVVALPIDFADRFEGPELNPSWQWPVNTLPEVTLFDDCVRLGIPLESPLSDRPVESAMIAVPRPAGAHYEATVVLTVSSDSDPSLWAGLSIVGDPFNTIGLGVRGDRHSDEHMLMLWERRGEHQRVVWHALAPASGRVHLRTRSIGVEHHLQFFYSEDGEEWYTAGNVYDASEIPAWDRGMRIGLMLEGPRGSSASFSDFELTAR
jgi:xylan 1,4-beta-xylosidase